MSTVIQTNKNIDMVKSGVIVFDKNNCNIVRCSFCVQDQHYKMYSCYAFIGHCILSCDDKGNKLRLDICINTYGV